MSRCQVARKCYQEVWTAKTSSVRMWISFLRVPPFWLAHLCHTAPVLPIIETTILVFSGSQVGDERYAFLFSATGHFKKVLIEASTGRRIIAGGDGTLPLSSRDDLTVTRPLYSKWHEVSTGVPRPCCMIRAVHQAGAELNCGMHKPFPSVFSSCACVQAGPHHVPGY